MYDSSRTYGCSPAGHLKPTKSAATEKSNVIAKPRPIIRKAKKVPQRSMASVNADIQKQLLQMIKYDTAELIRLRRGSKVFSGPQSGFGASLARNMISGFSGNPFASREKAVMARLRSNLDLLKTMQRRVKYNCDDLSKHRAIELYIEGHSYLDRDNDGKPCEYIRGKYQY